MKSFYTISEIETRKWKSAKYIYVCIYVRWQAWKAHGWAYTPRGIYALIKHNIYKTVLGMLGSTYIEVYTLLSLISR